MDITKNSQMPLSPLYPRRSQEKVSLIQADMSSYEEMLKMVSTIKEQAGHVDWLINNVGISTYDKYEDYTFEKWTKIVNTNLSVPVFLVKGPPSHYD